MLNDIFLGLSLGVFKAQESQDHCVQWRRQAKTQPLLSS